MSQEEMEFIQVCCCSLLEHLSFGISLADLHALPIVVPSMVMERRRGRPGLGKPPSSDSPINVHNI
jgi:hypothetical protein